MTKKINILLYQKLPVVISASYSFNLETVEIWLEDENGEQINKEININKLILNEINKNVKVKKLINPKLNRHYAIKKIYSMGEMKAHSFIMNDGDGDYLEEMTIKKAVEIYCKKYPQYSKEDVIKKSTIVFSNGKEFDLSKEWY